MEMNYINEYYEIDDSKVIREYLKTIAKLFTGKEISHFKKEN